MVLCDVGHLLQPVQVRTEHVNDIFCTAVCMRGAMAERQVCLEVERFATHYQVAEFLMENITEPFKRQ